MHVPPAVFRPISIPMFLFQCINPYVQQLLLDSLNLVQWLFPVICRPPFAGSRSLLRIVGAGWTSSSIPPSILAVERLVFVFLLIGNSGLDQVV